MSEHNELKLSIIEEKEKEILNYISQLDENSKKAYLIAKDHLGSSFNILKSNGYKEWKNNK
jgi:hypothetical protein